MTGVQTCALPISHETSDITIESYFTGKIISPIQRGKGKIVFDKAHENDFLPEEINPLISKLSEMGLAIDYLEDDSLENKLRYADAFVVISPVKAFTIDENNMVTAFLEKKGRLILISDPSREDTINSLSTNLGIVFKNDYLYHMEEHAGNFRYVFLDQFSSSPITKDIDRAIFFVSSSINADTKIGYANEGTQSSKDGKGEYASIVMAGDNVLAIGDLTFMTEPYNRALDNEKLISNIADFLMESKRVHTLIDFPFMLESPLDISYSNLTLLDEAISARSIFTNIGIETEISDLDRRKNMLYLGYFDDFEEGDRGLEGIYITNDSFEATGLGTFDKRDTVLIHLSSKSFRTALTILSEEKNPIQNVVDILKNGEINNYILSSNIAIYRYEPTEEEKIDNGKPEEKETNGVNGEVIEEETVTEVIPEKEKEANGKE